MLRLWRETIEQCRRTLDFWDASDFRVVVNGIDVTDAEKAATEARIAHLEKLISGVEGGQIAGLRGSGRGMHPVGSAEWHVPNGRAFSPKRERPPPKN